jgi:hypothetical protein
MGSITFRGTALSRHILIGVNTSFIFHPPGPKGKLTLRPLFGAPPSPASQSSEDRCARCTKTAALDVRRPLRLVCE